MMIEEYSDLTVGERRHMAHEMSIEDESFKPNLELGECLGCGTEYVVDPKAESDYCGRLCELLDLS